MQLLSFDVKTFLTKIDFAWLRLKGSTDLPNIDTILIPYFNKVLLKNKMNKVCNNETISISYLNQVLLINKKKIFKRSSQAHSSWFTYILRNIKAYPLNVVSKYHTL